MQRENSLRRVAALHSLRHCSLQYHVWSSSRHQPTRLSDTGVLAWGGSPLLPSGLGYADRPNGSHHLRRTEGTNLTCKSVLQWGWYFPDRWSTELRWFGCCREALLRMHQKLLKRQGCDSSDPSGLIDAGSGRGACSQQRETSLPWVSWVSHWKCLSTGIGWGSLDAKRMRRKKTKEERKREAREQAVYQRGRTKLRKG